MQNTLLKTQSLENHEFCKTKRGTEGNREAKCWKIKKPLAGKSKL